MHACIFPVDEKQESGNRKSKNTVTYERQVSIKDIQRISMVRVNIETFEFPAKIKDTTKTITIDVSVANRVSLSVIVSFIIVV